MKELVAREIAKRVGNNQVIGVGTGSTVDLAVRYIGERIAKEKMTVRVVPSSYESAIYCAELGLIVLSPLYQEQLDWGFDGADQVDADLRLIKGRGAALLKEKILVSKMKKFVVIIDHTKLVQALNMAVPIEVIPEALGPVKRALAVLSPKNICLRQASGKHGAVITEAGNFILDVEFDLIANDLEHRIKSIPGVVESGIFSSQAHEVLVADESSVRSLKRS